MNKPKNLSERLTQRWGLGVCLAVLAACTSPGYNDNPSQQVSNPRLGCPVATEFFSVYFNIHVQPPADQQDARVTSDVFRAYCNAIPVPGRVFLTVDLVGPELPRTPLALRVTELGDATETYAAPPLLDLPAQRYPKGVIEASFELSKIGDYAIYLGREGSTAEDEQLVIPLHVGDSAAAGGLLRGLATPLGVILAVSFSAYLLLRIRRRLP
jgi:hypothetical protein